MPETSAKIAAIYVRQSQYREESVSLETQEGMCRAAAVAKGRTLRVYSDRNVTGTRREGRKALDQLEADIKEIGMVIVYKVDRSFRNLLDFLAFLDVCNKNRVLFVSATEPYDATTAIGNFQQQTLGSLAELFSRQLGERVRDAKRVAASKGRWGGSPVPRGYRKGPARGELLPGDEFDMVRQAFQDILAGRSVRSISIQFGWRSSSTHMLLRNPFYCGRMPVGRLDGGWRSFRPNFDILPKGTHEPAISEETWLRVQDALDQRKNCGSRVPGATNPLAGLVRCGVCGRVTGRYRARLERYVVRCQAARDMKSCSGGGISFTKLERAVEEKLRWLEGNADEIRRQAHEVIALQSNHLGPVLAEAETCRRLLDKIERQKKRLVRHLYDEDLSPLVKPELRNLEGQRMETEDRLAQAERQLDSAERTSEDVEAMLLALGKNLGETWAAASSMDKRELLRQLGIQIRVWSGKRVEMWLPTDGVESRSPLRAERNTYIIFSLIGSLAA